MYRDKLTSFVGSGMFKQCEDHINMVKETRHLKVLEHQELKFDRIWQRYQDKNSAHIKQDHISMKKGCPNQSQDPMQKKLVINLSSTPLTPTQEVLFAHGPKFAEASKTPLIGAHYCHRTCVTEPKQH